MFRCKPSRIELLSSFWPGNGAGTARLSAATLSQQTVARLEYGTGTSCARSSESTVFDSGSLAWRSQYASGRLTIAGLNENKRLRFTSVQVLDMRQGFQTEEHIITTRTHSYRFTTVRLFWMRQTFSPTITSDSASAHPCQWQTIQLCVLFAKFSSTGHIESASSHPLGWEAVFLFRVRQTLSSESNPQSTCANPSRRATQLLNATFLHLFCYRPEIWKKKNETINSISCLTIERCRDRLEELDRNSMRITWHAVFMINSTGRSVDRTPEEAFSDFMRKLTSLELNAHIK